MPLIYQFLYLCVIANHGLSSKETNSIIAGCLSKQSCLQESCRDICDHAFNSLDLYAQVDEEAAANVSLHCTSLNFMMIKFNFGIYIIEQSTLDHGWGTAVLKSGSLASFTNLTTGTAYRYRFRRLTMQGEISRPEVCDWFSTFDADYQPLDVKSISLLRIKADDQKNVGHLRAEIAFDPAEDRSCNYKVLSWNQEHELVNIQLQKMTKFQFELSHLNYEENNIVYISSVNGDDEENSKTSQQLQMAFATPSCLEIHNNLSTCAPEKVKDLRVEQAHQESESYNIRIAWKKPEYEPFNYTVQVDLFDDEQIPHILSLPGNATGVSLFNLNLGPQYEVSIIAKSAGGTSTTSSIFRNPIPKTTAINFHHLLLIGLLIAVFLGAIFVQYCVRRSCKEQHFTMARANSINSADLNSKLLHHDRTIEINNFQRFICDEYSLRAESLKLKGILGTGAYGIVKLGTLEDKFNNVVQVAVKMLKDSPTVEEVKNFEQEIAIMKLTGRHQNIVSMIGCCYFFKKPMIIVEYCCKGDLQRYLRMIWHAMFSGDFDQTAGFKIQAESFTDSGIEYFSNNSEGRKMDPQSICMVANRLYDIQQDLTKTNETVTGNDLLNFARQIASGMEFLSSNRIIHRDLAARNVLVCEDKIVKISDFGLSRDVYQENLYRKQGNCRLPFRWMAIEALTHQIYTTETDVWSFAILLWEIVTMGGFPYPMIPSNAILKLLKSGYRMERPPNCSIELYNIMLSCWDELPQKRPSFTELKISLDKLLASCSENEYLIVGENLYDFECDCCTETNNK